MAKIVILGGGFGGVVSEYKKNIGRQYISNTDLTLDSCGKGKL